MSYAQFKHHISQYILSAWQDDWNGVTTNKFYSVKPALPTSYQMICVCLPIFLDCISKRTLAATWQDYSNSCCYLARLFQLLLLFGKVIPTLAAIWQDYSNSCCYLARLFQLLLPFGKTILTLTATWEGYSNSCCYLARLF